MEVGDSRAKLTMQPGALLLALLLPCAHTADPFSDVELDEAIKSLQNLASLPGHPWLSELRALISESAHESHKDWARTEAAADRLAALLQGPDDPTFRSIFTRVLEGGNWDGASESATARAAESKPWNVLVTGLNGIRKTTSVYQPWFKEVLAKALGESYTGTLDELPDGRNSYFRQLDYMMATLANERFSELFTIESVESYAEAKAEIFSRYRTYAEMLGALLLKEARSRRLNVMVETSGRDIGSFHYVDHFFPPSSGYRKLVLNFEINELHFAEQSVDSRMLCEKADGTKALAARDVRQVISANAGGPYGSSKLAGVQADSERVWKSVMSGEAKISAGWYKAPLLVHATPERWTVRAASTPRGGEGEMEFVRSVTAFATVGHLEESCPVQLSSWFDEWGAKIEAWWLATPFQSELGACTGALGLHLLSRFELALRAWRQATGGGDAGAPPPAAAAEAGCELLSPQTSDQLHLPEFPQFPDAFQGVAPLIPPIPRLLPEFAPDLLSEERPRITASARYATSAAGGLVVGMAAATAMIGFAKTRRARRSSF